MSSNILYETNHHLDCTTWECFALDQGVNKMIRPGGGLIHIVVAQGGDSRFIFEESSLNLAVFT